MMAITCIRQMLLELKAQAVPVTLLEPIKVWADHEFRTCNCPSESHPFTL